MADESDTGYGELFSGVEGPKGSEVNGGSFELSPEDRPRGILSPTDREYLCGLKEYAQPQTDANRRQDIRERVKNGLKDFALLWLSLERKEREKVFEDLGEDGTDEVIESMVSFAHLGLNQDQARMEERIQRGVLGAENVDKLFRSAGRATDVDVSINVEYDPDIEKLYERFEEGRELTDAEVGVLVRSGRLKSGDIEKLHESKTGFPGVYAGENTPS